LRKRLKSSPLILTEGSLSALEALRFTEGDLLELAERIRQARRLGDDDMRTVDCRDCHRRLALLAFPDSEPGSFVCWRHKPVDARPVKEVVLIAKEEAKALRRLIRTFHENRRAVPVIEEHDLFKVGPAMGIDGRLVLSVRQVKKELGFIDASERLRAMGGSGAAGPAALVSAARKGQYIKLNLVTNDNSSLLLETARKLETVHGQQSIGREYWPASLQDGTLLLLGFPGKKGVASGTPFHLDRLHALNVAFFVSEDESQVLCNEAVALWYFFHERHEDKVREVAANIGESLESVLSEESANRLAAAVGVEPDGTVIFHILRQYSGQPVHVAPGVFHSVCNLQPTLKIAIDVMLPAYLPLYGKLLSERFVENVQVPDYGHVDEVVTGILLKQCV
jgi:hypothetical protein